MSLFNRKQHQEENDSMRLIARLDERTVKYVTRRCLDENGSSVENVIGKNGAINTKNGNIVVVCNGKEVFRCLIKDAKCGELLSLAGVVICGLNKDTQQQDTIVAYYQYYR